MAHHHFRLISRVTLVTFITLAWLSHGIAAAAVKRTPQSIEVWAPETPEVQDFIHQHTAQSSLVSTPDEAMQEILQKYNQNIMSNLGDGCTEDNMIVRKEFGSATPEERRAFVQAYQCLMKLPPKTPKQAAPGVRNRFDDWSAAHLMLWTKVHFSPWNLAFHRQFIWLLEQAMREECGYQGGLLYWDSSKYLDKDGRGYIGADGESGPIKDPMFDNSDTSLSGDGDRRTPTCSCVTSGPFANMVVNMGPIAGSVTCQDNPRADGLGNNARCLERNFQPEHLQNMTYHNVATTILNSSSIDDFAQRLDLPKIGMHAIGHVFMGGLSAAIPAAAGDPWFFGHHARVDYMWSCWQNLDPENRMNQLPTKPELWNAFRLDWGKHWAPFGTDTPPAISLSDRMHISDAFDDIPLVQDIMSTTRGKYCYRYE